MKNIFKNFLVLFLVFSGLCLSGSEALASKLKFVQVSDTHFVLNKEDTSYKLKAQSKPLLEDAINQINNMKNVDFVMFTGDLIDYPNIESFDEVMPIVDKLNKPWYFALGNHDTTDTGKLTKTKMISLLLANNPNYNSHMLYYTFVPKKGFRVIVLDAVTDEHSVSTGFLPPEQLDFLDRILKKSKKDVVLIFIHHPLIQPYNAPDHRIINEKEFFSLLQKYKMPIGVFSGHYHMTKIFKRGNIISASCPSLISYPHAFRAVTVTNNKKQAVFEFLFYETGLKDLQNKTKFVFIPNELYKGKPNDRTTTIVIDKKRK